MGSDAAQVPLESRVLIRSDADIVTARQQGRSLAQQLGFVGSDLTVIVEAKRRQRRAHR